VYRIDHLVVSDACFCIEAGRGMADFLAAADRLTFPRPAAPATP
jgi:hypothetical protein